MLKPKGMEKIFVYGSIANSKAIISELYSLGALHIVEHRKSPDLDIGTPNDQAALCSSALVQLRSTAAFLDIKLESEPKNLSGGIKSRIKVIEQLHSKVQALNSSRQINEGELRRLAQDKEIASIASRFEVSNKLFMNTKHLEFFFGKVKNANGNLNESLHKITEKFELSVKDNIILLFIDKSKREEASSLLSKYGFSELPTRDLVAAPSTESYLKQIDSAQKKIQKEISGIHKEIAGLKKEYATFLPETEQLLVQEIEKAEAPLKFGQTKYSFVIQGYVPSDQYDDVVKKLNSKFKGLYIQDVEIGHDESVPIKLSNPKISSPFEFLMNLYTLPKYNELDPTSIMFITFPLIFGFMVGDMGYGLFGLILFYLLRRKFKAGKQLFDIMIAASISTIIFGFLFGEFFGFEEIGHHHLFTILVRSDVANINTLIMVSLAIGVLHLNFGLLLGFINEFHHHGFWHAFTAKISWMILQAGALMLFLKFYLIGAVLIGISIILLLIGEGVRGVIELPSIFGNILSYARLMALILAGVQLAVILNKFVGEFWHTGTVTGIIAGTLLFIFGHLINWALAMLGPFLHSLRLHYVEFFSKFYTGGGKEYKPFGSKQ